MVVHFGATVGIYLLYRRIIGVAFCNKGHTALIQYSDSAFAKVNLHSANFCGTFNHYRLKGCPSAVVIDYIFCHSHCLLHLKTAYDIFMEITT